MALNKKLTTLTLEQALEQGITAHKVGSLQEAERFYRAILETQPTHPLANHNLGLIALSKNQYTTALPSLKTALDENPKIDQFWISYIEALIGDNRFEEAKRVIKKAKIAGFLGENFDALCCRLKSLTDGSIPPQTELNKLSGYFNNQQHQDAEHLAISIINQFPNHLYSRKILGAVLKQSQRLPESLVVSEKVVALAPQDADAHYNLGSLLQELGRLEEASRCYRRVTELSSGDAEAYGDLGITLKQLGRLEEAEGSFRQVIKLKPYSAEAHSNLGIALQQLRRFDEAEASLKQAIALKPEFAGGYNNLGVMLKKIGRLDEAEVCYTQAIALDSDHPEAHCNFGIMLQELGRLDEAIDSYTRAIVLKSDYAEAYNNLGITQKALGRLDEAEVSLRKAIALDSKHSAAKHMLAALIGETTAMAPLDYVEGLFDSYAATFDCTLVDTLDYKIPRITAAMIINDSKFDLLGSIIDLGCGTGLFGTEIKRYCDHLDGIDLSEKMLDQAKEKNIYDNLINQDIVSYLSNASLNFDYFVSTDVFIYIGELSDVFRLIKCRNKKGGKLVFSTEDYNGDGFFLEQSGRYSHSKQYIENLCEKFGYKLRHFRTQALRKDNNQYIRGGLYMLDF